MSDQEKSAADGPGEAVIDEPTEHALDPAKDPNNEWEEKAAEQIEEGDTHHEGGAGGESGS